jgi:hypothetical protein
MAKKKNAQAQALVALRWKRTPPAARTAGARKAAVARWAKAKRAHDA